VCGADNQQERPVASEWVVGFVDGEGCFSVPIFRNDRCALGWQVQPEFAVVQAERSAGVLRDLQLFFACGRLSVNQRSDNHREAMHRFSVRRLDDLTSRIVPFFEDHPLRTAKQDEFRSFCSVLAMMRDGQHLTRAGLARIAGLAEGMNFRKRSRYLESSEAIRQPPRLDG
jgi:hypothetical protein